MKNLVALLFFSGLMPAINLYAEAQKWALLVGINEYESKDITPLAYANDDVKAFAEALIDPAVGAFEKDRVFLMTDTSTGKDRPKAVNIILRLDGLAQVIQPEDTFVFYFAGHGITSAGEPYLFAVDTEPLTEETLQQTSIPLKRLQQRLAGIKARQILFVCDSCRNEPRKARGEGDNLLSENMARGILVTSRQQPSGPPTVSATLFACSPGQRAYEWPDKGHGVFSYFLLEGLRGKAADRDGRVTGNRLSKYVLDNVMQWCKLHRAGAVLQTPWLQQEGADELVLAQVRLPSNVESGGISLPKPKSTTVEAVESVRREPETTKVTGDKPKSPIVYTEWPFDEKEAKRRQKETADILGLPVEYKEDIGEGVSLSLVLIPAGEFEMGSPDDEQDRNENEGPVHSVRISNPFYIGKYEVTVGQWKVVGVKGYAFDYPGSPYGIQAAVSEISHSKCFEFIKNINTMLEMKETDKFTLPTEAQWEYACRAGTETRFYWGDDPQYKDLRNYGQPSFPISRNPKVGGKKPNAWGLFDMVGNATEICKDFYAEYLGEGDVVDPTGPEPDARYFHVIRGGFLWQEGLWVGGQKQQPVNELGRSAWRWWFPPSGDIKSGFRVVRLIDVKQ